MAGFWTDLARHLAAYERAEAETAALEEFVNEHPDRPDLEPEDRDLIPESDVLDHHDTALARTA